MGVVFVLRLKELLFPAVADLAVLSVDVDIEKVRLDAQCTHGRRRLPGMLADVASAGRSVVLQLRVRRFRCRNTKCPRRTFVEQISGLPAGVVSAPSGCVPP
ncbi:hypothetical protein ACFY71_37735 [Streptomyces cinerochromogenes]|uniref:hypothetical protein n=1 Tax=Streptomyces cinerochromogenes TaxID=66422 RepID=UPI0036959EA7